MSFYALIHTMVRNDHRDRKRIGIYTSRQRAETVSTELAVKPGFRDPRGKFAIHQIEMGYLYLPDGFDKSPIAERFPGTANVPATDSPHLLFLVNRIDAPEYDDDFILVGLFATETDARRAAKTLEDRTDTSRYQIEFHPTSLDRVSWTEGFGDPDRL
jgi:hypothetical protein